MKEELSDSDVLESIGDVRDSVKIIVLLIAMQKSGIKISQMIVLSTLGQIQIALNSTNYVCNLYSDDNDKSDGNFLWDIEDSNEKSFVMDLMNVRNDVDSGGSNIGSDMSV